MICRACASSFDRGRRTKGARWYCDPCRRLLYKVQADLYAHIRLAIERGALSRPDEHRCIDCSGPASQWEHRDYFRPLDVEPVCGPCNKRRGPALTICNGVEHFVLEAA